MNIKPNVAQLEALKKIEDYKRQGSNKFLIVIPSGIGKTYLSAFETKGFTKRILYISHKNEINQQAIDSFLQVHDIDKDDIGIYNRRKKQIDKKIVFATIQTICRHKNLNKISKKHFSYIIIDEYHHISAISYQRIIKHFRPKYLLGLTATPFRYDRKDILKTVEFNVPFIMDIRKGIDNKLLVPFRYYGLYDNVDYSKIRWQGYGYTEKDLDKTLLINKRDKAIIKEFKRSVGDRQSIGFCCSVSHVKRCVMKFRKEGISCVGLTYLTKQVDRDDIINKFRKGEYQVIFTKDIFNEGVDFPEVKALLFLRPTFSKTVFLQQLGRGLRKAKGKKDVLVLDFIGNYYNSNKVGYWLTEIVKGEGERIRKPVYEHKFYGTIIFDRRLVKLFEFQEDREITKEKLISNYYDVKKKLGKQPRIKEMDLYGKYSSGTYSNYFGSWTEFLKLIDEKLLFYPVKNVTREKLINNYYLLKNKLGKQPRMKDIRRSKGSEYDLKVYIRVFKSWNIFLKEIKEPILMRSKFLKYDKKDMIDFYLSEKKRLGRTPTSEHFKRDMKYSDFHYTNAFGSWSKFMDHIGEPYRKLNISDKELLAEYHRVSKLIGKKALFRHEFDKHSKYNSFTITNRFGKWRKFVKKVSGIDLNKKIERTCPVCKKPFVTWKGINKKHCSMKCLHHNSRK
jgi:superfamily II DNA or RNA helicase